MSAKRNRLLLVSLPFLLSACAVSGPKFDEVRQGIAPVVPDEGRMYFYREAAFGGGAVRPNIKVNGDVVGESAPGGFFFIDLPPGQYVVSTKTEAENKIDVTLAKGQERYVKTYVTMGFFVGHVHPELVDPDQGRADIQKCAYTGAPVRALADAAKARAAARGAQASPVAPAPAAATLAAPAPASATPAIPATATPATNPH